MSTQSTPRPRVERSCIICHRRKVKCDKKLPCAQCLRGGYSCCYPQPGQVVRRARKTTISDVATRIEDLERTLSVVQQERGVVSQRATSQASTPFSSYVGSRAEGEEVEKSPSDEVLLKKGSSSQYFNEFILSRVIEQEHDVRTALATPRSESPHPVVASPFNPMGILSTPQLTVPLHSYHPSKLAAVQLWKRYVDSVDPCVKVLHIPTGELTVFTVLDDPSKASPESLGLCFAVYYSAMVSLEPDDGTGLITSMEERESNLYQFKIGFEQALAQADFLDNPTVTLLHALGIYLAALKVHNSGRGVWTLNGLAIRAAQSMGLHRDGSRLGLSPFESEIRRRLWWHFLGPDGRAAEDYGLHNTNSPGMLSSVAPPLNLDDNDLYPEMKELPPPRKGWTRMTLCVIHVEILKTLNILSEALRSAPGTPRESIRAQIVGDLNARMEEILKHCNTVVPQQRMTVDLCHFVVRKLDMVTRQQLQAINHPNDHELLASEEYLQEAISILEEADFQWNDDLFQPNRWIIKAYPQFRMMLYILWSICAKPDNPSAKRAFGLVETHLERAKSSERGSTQGSRWMVIMALRSKAAVFLHGRTEQQTTGENVEAGITPSTAERSYGASVSRDFAEGHDGGWREGPQDLPDWSALVHDFQLDATDFSILF